MKNLKFVFFLFFASIIFQGCAGNESSKSYNSAPTESSIPTVDSRGVIEDKSASTAPNAQVTLDQAGKSQPTPVTVTERKIIRNADLSLEANSPDESAAKITTIAESKGGFVIESQKQSSDTKTTKTDVVTMTVRVPAAKFNESLDEIRKTGNRIIVETVKGEDVTEQFIDMEARLKAKRALEEQFLEIMKRGNTVQDALNVQRELATVRGEIEQIEGKKRFLENQAAFSTLKIRLQSPAVFSTSSTGFFYQLGQAITRGFDAAMNFVLVLITLVIALLPFLIFIVLPIYLLIRYFLRRSKKQKLASEIARDEIKNE
jgi:hypothetical protein